MGDPRSLTQDLCHTIPLRGGRRLAHASAPAEDTFRFDLEGRAWLSAALWRLRWEAGGVSET